MPAFPVYSVLRDLLDQIVTCLGDPCPYQVLVSRGMPPADCSSIAAWYGGSRRDRDSAECATDLYETSLSFTVTHCCITPDQGVGFDFEREEIEAECFLENLMAIRECLACEATAVVGSRMTGCGALVSSVSVDPEPRGGCYSATIRVDIVESECCA